MRKCYVILIVGLLLSACDFNKENTTNKKVDEIKNDTLKEIEKKTEEKILEDTLKKEKVFKEPKKDVKKEEVKSNSKMYYQKRRKLRKNEKKELAEIRIPIKLFEDLFKNVKTVSVSLSDNSNVKSVILKQESDAYPLVKSREGYVVYNYPELNRFFDRISKSVRNDQFLECFNLVMIGLFAHEFGHFVYDHFKSKKDNKVMEIEADSYAGKMLKRLQCTREKSSYFIKYTYNTLKLPKVYAILKEDTANYPPVNKRIEVIEENWDNN